MENKIEKEKTEIVNFILDSVANNFIKKTDEVIEDKDLLTHIRKILIECMDIAEDEMMYTISY